MTNKSDYPSREGSLNDPPGNQGKQSYLGTEASDRGSSQEQHLEELVDRVLEQRLVIQETRRLRNRVGWLTGVLVVALVVLGGGFAWLAYRSQIQQERLAEITSETASSVDSERIQQLERQIQNLSQQLPEGVASQLEANQQRIGNLENQLNEVTTAVNENQQTLRRLSGNLQELELPQPESTSSPSPSGSNEMGTSTSPSSNQ